MSETGTEEGADQVCFSKQGGVAHLLLNRPTKRNAITPHMARTLDRLLTDVEADPKVRVAVISGAGEKAFCAGADLGAVASGQGDHLSTTRGGFGGVVRYPRTKPLIGAVHGFTVAGGFEIALSCDILIAAEGTVFALPEVTRGLLANGGGLTRLPSVVPPKVAYDLVLTGREMGVEEAATLGLVSRVVPAGEALTVSLEIAREMADRAPSVLTGSLRVMRGLLESAREPWWELSAALAREIRNSAGAQGAAQAFVESSKPV
jgi:enoyl-CoA hydratase/carnithine racemase